MRVTCATFLDVYGIEGIPAERLDALRDTSVIGACPL